MTVFSLMERLSAISLLVRPRNNKRMICSSRMLSFMAWAATLRRDALLKRDYDLICKTRCNKRLATVHGTNALLQFISRAALQNIPACAGVQRLNRILNSGHGCESQHFGTLCLANDLGNRTEDVAGHAQIDHEDVGRLGRGDGKGIGGAGAHRDDVEVRSSGEHACNAIEQHRMIVNERN